MSNREDLRLGGDETPTLVPLRAEVGRDELTLDFGGRLGRYVRQFVGPRPAANSFSNLTMAVVIAASICPLLWFIHFEPHNGCFS